MKRKNALWRYCSNLRIAMLTLLGERSWSQEGEDRVLWRYFGGRRSGFYIDIGAHHPHRFSNTNLFYRAGWNGINVDAAPGSMRQFRRWRKRDINLEIGVSEKAGSGEFYIFNEPALNTFNRETANNHSIPPWRIEAVVDVPLLPLKDILQQNCGDGRVIDFLSVDAEGHDISVLRSNDWERFRPKVVLAESLQTTMQDLQTDPCACFLRSVGYTIYAKTVNTVFYVDDRSRSRANSG
jgi:FkbM family methyltransferase